MGQIGYNLEVMDRMKLKLNDGGFERLDAFTWLYTFPDGKRFIKVELKSSEVVIVDFNGEDEAYQSPFGILEGLQLFTE